MAQDFAQYKDEEPILRDVTPNDRSKGQEATAKAFGAAAELAFKTGETLEKTESATMLTKSVGDAERIKTLYGSVLTGGSDERDMITIPLADTRTWWQRHAPYWLGGCDYVPLRNFVVTAVWPPA